MYLTLLSNNGPFTVRPLFVRTLEEIIDTGNCSSWRSQTWLRKISFAYYHDEDKADVLGLYELFDLNSDCTHMPVLWHTGTGDHVLKTACQVIQQRYILH